MANKDYNHLFKLLIIGDSSQCPLKFISSSGHMMFMVVSCCRLVTGGGANVEVICGWEGAVLKVPHQK